MSQLPKSPENHYGGVPRHHPEHDPNILDNLTDDNEDFRANAAEYNDRQEPQLNSDQREPRAAQTSASSHPSNYSEGGHGLPPQATVENMDNKDYAMNKDFSQGAKKKYENMEVKTRRSWWSLLRK